MSDMDPITWTDPALPEPPGIYRIPKNRQGALPEPAGWTHSRDVGKYRLCTHADRDGTVTNWQRELPDGEWAEVRAVSRRLVIPEAIEHDAAALEQFIDQQCERDGLMRLPGRVRTDCVAPPDETLVFADFEAIPLPAL